MKPLDVVRLALFSAAVFTLAVVLGFMFGGCTQDRTPIERAPMVKDAGAHDGRRLHVEQLDAGEVLQVDAGAGDLVQVDAGKVLQVDAGAGDLVQVDAGEVLQVDAGAPVQCIAAACPSAGLFGGAACCLPSQQCGVVISGVCQ